MSLSSRLSRSCLAARVAPALAAALLTVPAGALPPAEDATGRLAAALAAPVRSIPMANRINGWEQLDNQHVVLRLDDHDYLITLKDQCPGLTWAQAVAVTMSNNTIWAGFDAITADGWQCPIERINPLARPARAPAPRG